MKRRNLQYDIYQRLLSCLEKSGVSPEQLLNRAHKKGLSVGKCLSVSDDTKFSGLDWCFVFRVLGWPRRQ